MTQDPTRAAVEAAENYAYDPDSPREANSRDSWVDPKQAFLAGVKWQATAPKPLGDVREGDGAEGDIRIAIWNAAMKGGMGQDLSLAFINRAMAEPCMVRALAAPAVHDREGIIEPTDAQVREAMQTAWDDFCDDARAHPDDIYREGRKTFFRAGTWADHTAMHLRRALKPGSQS